MTKKELESLREFCVSRWPEKMGAIHGVGHWDRVAMFGKMLYQDGADKDVITGDITVNICFDSDRTDLLRVGILPVPEGHSYGASANPCPKRGHSAARHRGTGNGEHIVYSGKDRQRL